MPSAYFPVTLAVQMIFAREMAAISGGEAVITTATDVAGELSFDTFAKKYDMAIENIGQLKHISGALLAGKR